MEALGAPDEYLDNQVELSILVTCYNEEEFISETLEEVLAALAQWGGSHEVIVIDDASRDRSVQRVREFLERNPGAPVHLRVNPVNRGLANNYVEGAFLARGRYYRLCCGDNPEPRETLATIFAHVGEADMIIPYQEQKAVAGKTPARKALSRLFTGLVNAIGGYHIRYYNGLAIHRRYNVLRWHPLSYGFGFQADIITRLLDEGNSYLQVPAPGVVDRKGVASSAITMRNVLSVGHTLLELLIRRVRRTLYTKDSPRPREIGRA